MIEQGIWIHPRPSTFNTLNPMLAPNVDPAKTSIVEPRHITNYVSGPFDEKRCPESKGRQSSWWSNLSKYFLTTHSWYRRYHPINSLVVEVVRDVWGSSYVHCCNCLPSSPSSPGTNTMQTGQWQYATGKTIATPNHRIWLFL